MPRRSPRHQPSPRAAFEPLEPRLLLAGDLPSISLIEADNRGLVVLTASRDLNASTVSSASVEVSTAGADQIFGTADDTLVARTVAYDAATRRITVNASVAADQRFRVRLDSSIIRGADARRLDGEFTGASTISGDGVEGGDLLFFTRRPDVFIARFTSISGIIDVTLFTDRTPLTVQNFLNYANRGVWDATFIHRSVTNFVIQGGGFTARGTNDYPRIPQDPPVLNEPGITNIRGTIAMAKLGGNPNSATNEWFFNLGNNAANLDNQNGGFTVFGEVRTSAGLSVMDALAAFQVVNASQVNSAFNEIPVVDRTAVISRPGAFTLLTSDLIRFTRIALLVGVGGEPAQQLPTEGSVTITRDASGEGPVIQVFDLDGVGLGDLSGAIDVRFGRGNAISSITLRDGLPAARIGIVVTNASSIGSITDARRAPIAGNVSFILSTAPVSSVRFAGPLSGFNLNGFVVPGIALADDLDGDGDFNDATALLIQQGRLATLTLSGGVTGDVVVPGGFGSVVVGGDAVNADFDANATTGVRPTFSFNRVLDSEVRVADPIASIRAAQWHDSGGRAERILAPALASLRITGGRDGATGDFQAGLDLSSPALPGGRALGPVSISGGLFGSAWAVRGAIDAVSIRGAAYNWTINSATSASSITAGAVTNGSFTFTGRISRITVTEWQGGVLTAGAISRLTVKGDPRAGIAGDFSATVTINAGGQTPVLDAFTVAGSLRDSMITITGPVSSIAVRGAIDRATLRVNSGVLRSITADAVIASTISSSVEITSITAGRYEYASLQGNRYGSITSRGDFIGDIGPNAIGTVRIDGDFTGSIGTRRGQSLTINGNLRDAFINFTFPNASEGDVIDAITIGGVIERSTIRAQGPIGRLTARAMIDSGVYLGAPANAVGLPASGTGFRQGARLGAVLLRGQGGGLPTFQNSFLVATELGGVRFEGLTQADNFGSAFGVAAGTITSFDASVSGTRVRLSSNSTTPAPVGDFNAFVAFTPPPGSTV